MTHQEAEELREKYLYLKGSSYTDVKHNQVDKVIELVITPQDHPFFPEFISFYHDTGSYIEASEKSFEKHQEDIIYSVKCVLQEIYHIHNDLEMHVLMDLDYVLKYAEPQKI